MAPTPTERVASIERAIEQLTAAKDGSGAIGMLEAQLRHFQEGSPVGYWAGTTFVPATSYEWTAEDYDALNY